MKCIALTCDCGKVIYFSAEQKTNGCVCGRKYNNPDNPDVNLEHVLQDITDEMSMWYASESYTKREVLEAARKVIDKALSKLA